MDKQTFCSSQTTSNTSRYAAALYRQGTREWAPGAVLMEAGGGREQDGGWDGDRPSPHSARHRRGQASCGDNRLSGLEVAISRDFWPATVPADRAGAPGSLSSWCTGTQSVTSEVGGRVLF